MLERSFQEARLIAEDLAQADPKLVIEIRSLVEADWLAYLGQKKRELRGRAFQHSESEPLVIHSVLGYLGGLNGLIEWGKNSCGYKDPRQLKAYSSLVSEFATMAHNEFNDFIRQNNRKFCFFEFDVDGSVDRVTFELFTDKCPKTCENFLALCTGDRTSSEAGTILHYKNTPIHRIVKDAWIQGGDIVAGKGDQSESIWGGTFPDESFSVKHSGPGILAMASSQPHANGSQFYITLRELPFLDNKHVAFGRVVCGRKVLSKINSIETVNQRPKAEVIIQECGETIAAEAPVVVPKTEEPQADPTRLATFVVIGLDNAGKSTIVNNFMDKAHEDTMPTMGFDLQTAVVGDYKVKFFGLGGATSIRGYWRQYYDEIHGVIYVIDASDADRIDEAVESAKEVLNNSKVEGKPVLFYLNKQDLENPLSAAELALKLGLDTDSGKNKIVTSTALVREGAQPDENIPIGLKWLLEKVGEEYDSLSERVGADMAERKAAVKAKREAAETPAEL